MFVGHNFFIISASPTINVIERTRTWNRPVTYPMCRSVWKVYCGKTADWIRMPFGVVSGVGRPMSILDGDGDHQRGRDSFG